MREIKNIKINGVKKPLEGKSAYEIALEEGFEGTKEEWLASLKGEKGEKGAEGKDCTEALLELENVVFTKTETENLLNSLEVVPASYIAQNSADYGIPTENPNGWATSGFIECKKGDTFYISLAAGETNDLSLSYVSFHVAEYASNIDGEKAIANSITDVNTVVDDIYKSYTILNDDAKFFRFSFAEGRGRYIITKNHKPTEYSEYFETRNEENYLKRYCSVDNSGKMLVVGKDGYISFEKKFDEIALAVKKINPKLNYIDTITHDELITVKSYNKNDVYVYVGENAMEVYNSIIRNGDIIVNGGGMSKWYSIGNVSDNSLYANNAHYDICIVGGGAGGIGAAYALKDSGYKVCLIEKLPTLGGTHCNAGVIDMLASPNPPFLNSIIEELYGDGNVGKCYVEFGKETYHVGEDTESTFTKKMRGSEINYGTAQSDWGNDFKVNPVALQKVYERDLRESIDILTNRKVTGCKKVDSKIVNVSVYNSKSCTTETIWADYFIDASADGVLCRFETTEGVDFYIGSDAKDLYNEAAIATDFAGNKYEINTMGATYCVSRTEQSLPVFDIVDAKPNDNVYGAVNATWDIPPRYTLASNKGFGFWYVGDDGTEQGIRATIVDPEKYSDITPQDYIDNGYGYAYDKAKNTSKTHFVKKYGTDTKWNFVGLMPLLAMRETYRIKCDKMLTQSDIETLATSENIAENEYIALSSWWVDLHDNVSVDKSKIAFRQVFGIPYRCLVPTSFSNVLVGCRAFGASHIALSASRLTKTMMCLGYAAGKAMSLARQSWLDDVRNVNVGQLQADCGVIDKMEELEKYFSFGL